ncbi:hypothetical protein [Vibrio harveyi]|uniref:hypothetical protein n=1 Tax=Vibrio harveyi TaxID=669 RepID=UPI003BB4F9B1|nr:hypothetical protein [Vibrio harveyi]
MAEQLFFSHLGKVIKSSSSIEGKTRFPVHFGLIENADTANVKVYVFGYDRQLQQLGFLVGRFGITGNTEVVNNVDGKPLGTIASLTKGHLPRFIENYKASNGENFRVELDINDSEQKRLRAYPYEEYSRSSVTFAEALNLPELKKIIEQRVNAEATA